MSNLFWFVFGLIFIVDLLFSAIRASLLNASVPKLFEQSEEEEDAVERTMQLMTHPRMRASLRSGLMLTHFILAILIWFGVDNLLLDPQNVFKIPISMGVMLLTVFIILAIELIIEGFVLNEPEKWAVRLTPLGQMMNVLFRPFSWVMGVMESYASGTQRSMASVTEYELKSWVEEEETEGSLELKERKMIYSIFQFSETLCREVMVPRIDVFALDVNTTIPEAIIGITESGHSRVPVFEETIDNVVGLLYAKDILKVQMEFVEKTAIRDLLRQAYYVPEAKKVDELLREMQARGVHISIVVDEYGGMAGLVTLEDIVEEIVGEIRDEYDEREEVLFQQVSEEEYILHGRIDLDDFNDELKTDLDPSIADTLGGYIYGDLGRVPSEEEEIRINGWILIVEEVIGRRIRTVRALKVPVDDQMEEKGNGID
ncbi:MAG: HlyC/CorC family transporter [Anaerolineaceae bacterium]|nr:HlyC/CorC family transporter [Anaerolineaceae bacterium]